MSNWRDIGEGVSISPARCTDADGVCLYLIKHEHRGIGECIAAAIPLARSCRAGNKEPWWSVENEDPLTLSPSIACPCGLHGFIRDGRWVPA